MRTHQLHREAHPELARQLFALVVKHLHIKQAHEVVDVELFVSTIGHHIRHIRIWDFWGVGPPTYLLSVELASIGVTPTYLPPPP